ncbi:MAG: cobyric acid synthase [Desulfomonile tiedjei]|nr:cobyric acid synthase [Desulfomonile tiedjei]
MANFKHGGRTKELAERAGLPESRLLDFSANINPLGPPEWLRAVVSSSLESVVNYPDPYCRDLKRAVASRYNAELAEVLVGNGSTELIYLIPAALQKSRVIVPVPSYSDYVSASELAGLEAIRVPLREDLNFRVDFEQIESHLTGDEIVFLGHPNNPTGAPLDVGLLRALAARHPSTVFVIDEAFVDLAHEVPSFSADRAADIIVLISLTKTFAIPGLRLGCALAEPKLVRKVEAIQQPWSVNRISQAVGCAAMADSDYVATSRTFVHEQRQSLAAQIKSIPGLKVYPGHANFLLVRIDRGDIEAHGLAAKLLERGIAIRVCDNFEGLDKRYFRVAVRTAEENSRLVESLGEALGLTSRTRRRPTRPAIMFQGTSSNAGKSVLTAALCRILLQDGYRVAPFKSQNMSLNSFVTRAGGEMGRAQVVQAQACRLEPDVRMNPILLKPNSDTGSQVIINGKPVGNMDVLEYVEYKPQAFASACEAFDSLAADFDVVVLEGAGSPAEVNLKHHDIANMKMAKYANSPVILVGDIDRGGVFGSFVGTMEVLAEWERRLVAGFLVNRFRGRADILSDALDYTERHTGRPVIGVVPFLQNLGLPEEDSVTFKSGFFDDHRPQGDHVEIAVIDLPHISNFTDFDAFRTEPDVRLRVVRSSEDLDRPDAIILPGSKNVPGDLAHLRENGLADKISSLGRSGRTEIVGVCGGFQMIGQSIADPHKIESDGQTIEGLGLLKLSTVMAIEKTLTRVRAVHLESGQQVTGYEIHHGQTRSDETRPMIRRDDGQIEGVGSPDGGRCWGTYLHGIFDADGFRRWFIDRLRVRKGLPALGKIAGRYNLEPAIDRLADAVRCNIKMDFIYKQLGL